MLRIETRATLNEESRTIWIHDQQIYLEDQLICSVPPRTLNMMREFTPSQLLIINQENISSVLSQKLLGDLLRESSVKELLVEQSATMKS